MNETPAKRSISALTSKAGATAIICLCLSGCGNQMFRQASYEPLDTPRASAPADSVPVDIAHAPSDAQAVNSPANGDLLASEVAPNASTYPIKEQDLPAPDLSDNAQDEGAPATVNDIQSPYPLADSRFVVAGDTLFLNRCVQCHNAGGYGYGVVGSYLVPHPPDLASTKVQKRTDGALFWIVTVGQGKMPGFRTWMTPEERWAVVSYVRSLRDAPNNSSLLLGKHVSDTTSAPYPVYGEPGFEHGKDSAPFKDLMGAPSPTSSRVYSDNAEPAEIPNGQP